MIRRPDRPSLHRPPHTTTSWGCRTSGFFFLFPGLVVLLKPEVPDVARLVAGIMCVAGACIVAWRTWPTAVRQRWRVVPLAAAATLMGLSVLSDGHAFQTWEIVLWYAAGLMWIGLTQAAATLWVAPLLAVSFLLTTPGPVSASTLFAASLTVGVMTIIAFLVASDLRRSRHAYRRLRHWGRYMSVVARTGHATPRRDLSEIHQSTTNTVLELGFSGAGVAHLMIPREKWEWRSWSGVSLDTHLTRGLRKRLFDVAHREGIHRIKHQDGEVLFTSLLRSDDVAYVLVAYAAQRIEDEQLQAVELLAAQTSRSLEILQMAFYDQLTRLPNRSLFRNRLAEHLARTHQDPDYAFALLYLDMDRFKAINDLYGHAVGDLFLAELATRLRGCLRGLDYISHKAEPTSSRLGGDEFAVLLPHLAHPADAAKVAERVQMVLSEPVRVEGREVHTRPSIGVVLSDEHYTDPSEMMRDADTAMYCAKTSDDRQWAVFDGEMRVTAERRLALEKSLVHALDRQEISLVYQPIAITETGRPVGFEALMRWSHPTLGPIPASEFIPIAENTGDIANLTLWAIEHAVAALDTWSREQPRVIPLYVTVNLSRKQIGDGQLLDHLFAVLSASTVAPAQVVIEITESLALVELEQTRLFLRALKSLGLRLALDDFGTGYSSLSCLHELPIDIVKLDHGFVEAAENETRALRSVQGVIRMAHALGLEVVAEGVERPAHYELMKRVGCDLVQGYLIAHPLEPLDVPHWLAKYPAGADASAHQVEIAS